MAVIAPVDAQRDRQTGRSTGQISVVFDDAGPRPPIPGELGAFDDLPSTDQHTHRAVCRAAHEVDTKVQSHVAVHIQVTTGLEHCPITSRLSTESMRTGIVFAHISLDFAYTYGDRAFESVVPQHAAQQIRRNVQRRPSEEISSHTTSRGNELCHAAIIAFAGIASLAGRFSLTSPSLSRSHDAAEVSGRCDSISARNAAAAAVLAACFAAPVPETVIDRPCESSVEARQVNSGAWGGPLRS